MKELNWSQLPFNPFTQKLHPEMINDGLVVTKDIAKHNTGICKITYDRSFIIEFIVSQVLVPLMIANYNDFQSLMSEAWKKYKGTPAK